MWGVVKVTGMMIEARPGRDVVLRVGEVDPLEAARDYSSCHPDFRGRIEVHSTTASESRSDTPVHLWGIFEVTAPGKVEWVFAQFRSERREFSVR